MHKNDFTSIFLTNRVRLQHQRMNVMTATKNPEKPRCKNNLHDGKTIENHHSLTKQKTKPNMKPWRKSCLETQVSKESDNDFYTGKFYFFYKGKFNSKLIMPLKQLYTISKLW